MLSYETDKRWRPETKIVLLFQKPSNLQQNHYRPFPAATLQFSRGARKCTDVRLVSSARRCRQAGTGWLSTLLIENALKCVCDRLLLQAALQLTLQF